MDKLLLTFDSVNYTIATEKYLKEQGYEIKTIPTPREITTSCGLAIMMDMKYVDDMKALKEKGKPIGYIWKYSKDEAVAEQLA